MNKNTCIIPNVLQRVHDKMQKCDSIFSYTQTAIANCKELQNLPATFEDYHDDMKQFQSSDLIDDKGDMMQSLSKAHKLLEELISELATKDFVLK